MVTAAGDIAPRLALWQYFYGGTWSPEDFADSNSLKHYVCALLSSVPMVFNLVPFENARRAYFADRTWPLEMRRGYTSPLNALLRIPFEEGPYYLFKGGFPLAVHSFFFWTSYFTFYTFAKNKFFFLWVYDDFPYEFIKLGMMSVCFMGAAAIAYPAYFTREMVDIWPKERGGHCSWDNNYRKAFSWMIDNIEMLYVNYLPGFWTWFRRHGATYFVALWMADTVGMFSNCNEPMHGLETMFPISVEAI